MVVLYVLLGLVAFILLLLLFPVRLVICYRDGEGTGFARYLFFTYGFSPEALAKREERQIKRGLRKKMKQEEKAEPPAPKAKKKMSAMWDTFQSVWKVVRNSGKGLRHFLERIHFRRLELAVVIGGEDARQVAESYGRWGAWINALLPIADRIVSPGEPKVTLFANFITGESHIDFVLDLQVRPLAAVSAALIIIFSYLREEGFPKKSKGGAKHHEPATSCQ